jgi:hypothetical protein
MNRGPALIVALLTALATGALWLRGPEPATLAIRAREAAALCRAEGYPLPDFLERAKAIGVQALVADTLTIADLERRGQALVFTRAEVEKWKALGMISPAAPIKPNSVWIKSPELAAAAAAAAKGALASSATAGGYVLLEFPQDFDPVFLSVGPDPDVSSAARKAGLAVIDEDGSAEAWQAVDLASPKGFRRAAFGSSKGLIAALPIEGGVERGLESLRAAGRELRSSGQLGGLVTGGRAGAGLALLLVVFGPLVAARAGLNALRTARLWVAEKAPQGSPVLEVAASTLSAAVIAWLIGGLLGVLGGVPGGEPRAASFAALVLFAPEWGGWKPDWTQPLTVRLSSLKWLAWAAVFACGVRRAPFDPSWAPWWWSARWREALLGVPAMTVAFRHILAKWSCPDCESNEKRPDPRPFLLLGILGSASAVFGSGLVRLPLGSSLAQTLAAWAAGSALGAALLAVCGEPKK